MRLETDDVVLRPYKLTDRDSLLAIADNPNVAARLTARFPNPYRPRDADTWLELVSHETRNCNFAIEWRDNLVGGIGLEPMRDVYSGTAEIGYWLGEPFWGRGLATIAVSTLLPYAFDELLFIRLQAMVFADNIASMRVLEKNGFSREGVLRKHISKNGKVTDGVLYAKLRNP